jgi:hypothetical protein
VELERKQIKAGALKSEAFMHFLGYSCSRSDLYRYLVDRLDYSTDADRAGDSVAEDNPSQTYGENVGLVVRHGRGFPGRR